MYDDDRDALAAEYVLGTLSADERDQAEALLAIDPGFAEIVRVWERRLGELNVMVEAVEPPAGRLDKIQRRDRSRRPERRRPPRKPPCPPFEEPAPPTTPDAPIEMQPRRRIGARAAIRTRARGTVDGFSGRVRRKIWTPWSSRKIWTLRRRRRNWRKARRSPRWLRACCRPEPEHAEAVAAMPTAQPRTPQAAAHAPTSLNFSAACGAGAASPPRWARLRRCLRSSSRSRNSRRDLFR